MQTSLLKLLLALTACTPWPKFAFLARMSMLWKVYMHI